MSDGRTSRWALFQDVPIVVVLTIVFQTVAAVIWAVRIDSRVDYLDKANDLTVHRLNAMTDALTIVDRDLRKLPLIDERQQRVLQTLEDNARRLDALNTTQQRIREEMLRQFRLPPPEDSK